MLSKWNIRVLAQAFGLGTREVAADASLVAMCERRSIASVATLDQHFDVYRTADRKRLRNVFSSG